MEDSQQDSVAQGFIQHYYGDSTGADALSKLYRDESTLSWEGRKVRGGSGIVEKLSKHLHMIRRVLTTDIHPTRNGGFIAVVTGSVFESDAPPLFFSETFELVLDQASAYYVANQILRFSED
ncbi:NTF2-like protein, partial [Clavulina sp. PMI_390]